MTPSSSISFYGRMVIECELPLTRYVSPPPTCFPLTHFWEGGGAFVVVGKPVTTLQRNKNTCFDFTEVGWIWTLMFYYRVTWGESKATILPSEHKYVVLKIFNICLPRSFSQLFGTNARQHVCNMSRCLSLHFGRTSWSKYKKSI